MNNKPPTIQSYVKNTHKFLSRFAVIFPLRIPFWLILTGFIVLITWVKNNNFGSNINREFVNLIVFLLIALIVIIFIVSLITFLIYLITAKVSDLKNDATYLTINNTTSYNGNIGAFIAVPLKKQSHLLQIKVAFCLDDRKYTNPSPLFTSDKNEFQMGDYNSKLPQRLIGGKTFIKNLTKGRYKITRSLLLFEDILGLFRFVYEEREESYDFIVVDNPQTSNRHIPTPQADITEKESQLKVKMPGEYLEFKKYNPSSDSTRFILWKVFARTDELLVRRPERENPNSAKIPLMVNFHNNTLLDGYPHLLDDILNNYKSSVLRVVESVKKQNFVIDYFPEDIIEAIATHKHHLLNDYDDRFRIVAKDRQIEAKISAHNYQSNLPIPKQLEMLHQKLAHYKNIPNALLLFTSSLDTSWLDIYKRPSKSQKPVVFLKRISREFFNQKGFSNPLYNIIFTNPSKKDWHKKSLFTRIKYSQIYHQILANEKTIAEMARKLNITVVEV